MLRYTICFVRFKDEILLLNREKNPNMGMWNGVGGKIEPGETHLQSVIRETFEETGIKLINPVFSGQVLWNSNRGNDGMYVYLADLSSISEKKVVLTTDEGIISWKKVDWIFDETNKGIVDNIKYYLPEMLDGNLGNEHIFTYENGIILNYKKRMIRE